MDPRRYHILKICGALLTLALLERLAYSGVSSDLQIYLTSVLGLSTVEATAKVVPSVGGTKKHLYSSTTVGIQAGYPIKQGLRGLNKLKF